MKQVIQNYRSGELKVEDVPVPRADRGMVLVRNHYSVISAGTERAMIELARKSLVGKAKDRPDLVRKVLDKAKAEGLMSAVQQAFRRLDTPKPLGYSSAGTVIEVGRGVDDIRPGDRVACAGAGYASHAEVVCVPRNLCVTVPGEVELKHAAFSTLGAIAMQGVRITGVTLGERVAVIGLGLLGQITVQLLKAAGCRVLGIDLEDWKLELAKDLGADGVVNRGADDLAALIAESSGGRGVDAVLVTAATSSSDPLHLAGEIARDRATVTIVGIVSMEIPHKVYYEKELRVLMSRSYGPGRYDRQYEERGHDYPIGYVRWTENRNMESFMDLLAQGRLSVESLVTQRFPIEDAESAYERVTGRESGRTLGVLLEYHPENALESRIRLDGARSAKPVAREEIGVGVIGAGQFATGTLLPALKRVRGVNLRGLATAGGMSGKKSGDKFGFAYCTTDHGDVLADPNVHAVLILTRNSQHAPMAAEALAADKAVFVEKPLATSMKQLKELTATWRSAGGQLMVGFNRRYAPFTRKIVEFWEGNESPAMGTYRVNAGPLSAGSWVSDEGEGGGRLVAEVCHFVDYLQYVFRSPVVGVHAESAGPAGKDHGSRENIIVTLSFENGSLGSILYVTTGDKSFSKERVEIFRSGSVAVLDDFRRVRLTRGGRTRTTSSKVSQDKGHAGELETFFGCLRGGTPLPGSFEDYARVTLATFAAERSLETRQPVKIDLGWVGLDV